MRQEVTVVREHDIRDIDNSALSLSLPFLSATTSSLHDPSTTTTMSTSTLRIHATKTGERESASNKNVLGIRPIADVSGKNFVGGVSCNCRCMCVCVCMCACALCPHGCVEAVIARIFFIFRDRRVKIFTKGCERRRDQNDGGVADR